MRVEKGEVFSTRYLVEESLRVSDSLLELRCRRPAMGLRMCGRVCRGAGWVVMEFVRLDVVVELPFVLVLVLLAFVPGCCLCVCVCVRHPSSEGRCSVESKVGETDLLP